ncbi:MAG: hypothetical protein JSV63_00475 [Candidatus Aenigmatarchaeota archaeon]|nr:MAG: hypothetical protein JSV63_00475 [Candidatus Aenigmarchaeota archaeon]
MKGQFFIIGAIFICVLLFFGISPTIQITGSPSTDMEMIAENLRKEFPPALNIGINSSAPLMTLQNFTTFAKNRVLDRGVDLDVLHVVFIPSNGSTNVSVYNSMDVAKVIGVNVSGTHRDIEANLDTLNYSIFTVPVYGFNLTLNIDGDETYSFLLSNKTSIYSLISLERGDDVVRKELLA